MGPLGMHDHPEPYPDPQPPPIGLSPGPLASLSVWKEGTSPASDWPSFFDLLQLGQPSTATLERPEGTLGIFSLVDPAAARLESAESWFEQDPSMVLIGLLPEPDLKRASELQRAGAFEVVLSSRVQDLRDGLRRGAWEARIRRRWRDLRVELLAEHDAALDGALFGPVGHWRHSLLGGPVAWCANMAALHGRHVSSISRTEAEGWIHADFQKFVREKRDEASQTGLPLSLMYCLELPGRHGTMGSGAHPALSPRILTGAVAPWRGPGHHRSQAMVLQKARRPQSRDHGARGQRICPRIR